MNRLEHFTFSSKISDIEEINESFDKGVLSIAYTGENRNQSSISKEAFEDAVPTLFNCPVVCNYNREDDSIGGHDVDIVKGADGELKLINVTQPVGVVPESSKVFWQDIDDHEYICCEVLLWKRQEAYSKIKEDGIVAHSMEITVKDGFIDKDTGIYEIKKFEFNALCLLGEDVTPCFEESKLQLFSVSDFKKEMEEMMNDLKNSQVVTSSQEDNIKDFSSEGGNRVLEDNKIIEAEDLEAKKFDEEDTDPDGTDGEGTDDGAGDNDPETDPEGDPEGGDPTGGEGEEGGSGEGGSEEGGSGEGGGGSEEGGSGEGGEGGGEGNTGTDPEPTPDDGDDDDIKTDKKKAGFELSSNIRESLYEQLDSIKIEDEYGSWNKYWLYDIDFDASEIYVIDSEDGHIYGFKYSMNGDYAVIDFKCKKRKKCTLVDYDEGDPAQDVNFDWASDMRKTISEKSAEIEELKEFKLSVETEKLNAEKAEMFAKFDCLKDIEEFKTLISEADKYSLEELEDKCFAIKGRNNITAQFSTKQGITKIKLPEKKVETSTSKYGDLFERYLNK